MVLKSQMLCFSFIYCFLLLEVSFNLYPVFAFDEVFTSLKRRVYSLVYSLAVVLYISTNLIPLNYIPSLSFSQVYFKLLIDTSPTKHLPKTSRGAQNDPGEVLRYQTPCICPWLLCQDFLITDIFVLQRVEGDGWPYCLWPVFKISDLLYSFF